MGAFALLWAAAAAGAGTSPPGATSQGPAVQASSPPKIQILNSQAGLAGTCGGSAFNLNTFISVDTQASANVQVSASGVGVIEEFTDETGKNIGPYDAQYPNFQIPAFGGGLAPNTAIQVTITTYAGPGLTGRVTYTSAVSFNCSTGAIAAPSVLSPQPVPTLSAAALGATAALLALLGLGALRRPASARRRR